MSIKALQERRIVVIGGGIIGCTSAYYLTQHPLFSTSNCHITLVEASTIAAGASGKAAGLVANWAFPHELGEISFEEHKKLATRYGGKERWGWREVACGKWTGRARAAGDASRTQTSSSNSGLHSRDIGSAQRATGFPDDLDWVDEVVTDSYVAMAGPGETAQVYPYEFTTSMLALAREMAGERLEVVEGAKVVSIDRGNATAEHHGDKNSDERVVGVTYAPTTTGSHTVHIPADIVLLAAGPWSPTLLPSLPITYARAHSIVMEPSTPLSPHVLFTEIHSADGGEATPEIYARPQNRAYACCTLGDEEPLPPLASLVKTSQSTLVALREDVGSISIPLRDGRVEVEQACYMPLGGPIVGMVDQVRGLVVATGHTVWGICNAPGTAKAVAELIMEGKLGKEWRLGKLEPKRFLKK